MSLLTHCSRLIYTLKQYYYYLKIDIQLKTDTRVSDQQRNQLPLHLEEKLYQPVIEIDFLVITFQTIFKINPPPPQRSACMANAAVKF